MNNYKLAIIAQESGIEREKAESIWVQFEPFIEAASKAADKVVGLEITSVEQKDEMKLARETRLELRRIRVEAKKTHDKLKEDSLREGRFIDSVNRLISDATTPIEAILKEKEEFAERQEAARIERLVSERKELLSPYGVDTQFYNLGQMSEEAFSNLFETIVMAHEAKQEAARKLEEERIAREKKEAEERVERERLEAEERARVAAENARLKAEAEERERQIAAERAKAEAERKAVEEKAREEREEREAEYRKRQAEEKAARERAEAEIRKARDAEDKARRELEEKINAESKAKLEEQRKAYEEQKRLEAAGDIAKLKDYLERLKAVAIKAPELKNGKCRAILIDIERAIFDAIAEAGDL